VRNVLEKTPLGKWRDRGVDPAGIPSRLKRIDQWVVWTGREKGELGKFDKMPVHPTNGYKINFLDPKNHMSFDDAFDAYSKGVGDGIGIVLTGEPVSHNEAGEPLYLVGIDLDGIASSLSRAKTISTGLKTYREISPSGKGIRLIALSRTPFGKGNAKGGREMYSQRRFLTITGWSGKNDVREATAVLESIEQEWWPEKTTTAEIVPFTGDLAASATNNLAGIDWPESEENISKITSALNWIPPTTNYEEWRDVIWSVAFLDWECGLQVLTDWSNKSEEHWGSEAAASSAIKELDKIYNAFDVTKGLTVGTLFHTARTYGAPTSLSKQTSFDQTNALGVSKSTFNILSRKELNNQPPSSWLVKDLIHDNSCATIYGPPGSGKTFLALDLAASIASGKTSWFGRKLKPCSVVYIALEGGSGIKKRLVAWDQVNAKNAGLFYTVLDPLDLRDTVGVKNLIEAIKQASLTGSAIFIDTFAQATPGSDENSSSDMGKAISACQLLSRELGCTLILVHHSGKDASKGLRGHSSMAGAIDTIIEVKNSNSGRRWTARKVKDAEDGFHESFELKGCDVGVDADGNPETSCAVVPISPLPFSSGNLQSNSQSPSRLPPGKNQKLIYSALRDRLTEKSTVSEVEGHEIAKDALPHVPQKQKSTRAKDALEGMISNGFICFNGGFYSLPQ
jgi:hypothetical protein